MPTCFSGLVRMPKRGQDGRASAARSTYCASRACLGHRPGNDLHRSPPADRRAHEREQPGARVLLQKETMDLVDPLRVGEHRRAAAERVAAAVEVTEGFCWRFRYQSVLPSRPACRSTWASE